MSHKEIHPTVSPKKLYQKIFWSNLNQNLQFLIFRVSTFKCLKENSKEFVIVSANYYDSGEANLNAELNIINARTAGIENIDIMFSPCIQPSSEYDLCGDGR